MAAYAEWGRDCVNRFRGMFGFAIWDANSEELFAGRDLFGEKPLYYATTSSGSLVAASEIKAILASGLVSARLDPAAVDAYLALGYVPPDRTIYSNILTLPPAHWLVWNRTGVTVRRYWQPRFDSQPVSLDDATTRLNELLQRAVRRQMVADVPVGAFLSGGHDSSTVVALMQAETRLPVKTFSVGFGKYINELPYARAVAERYRTEHHAVDLGTPPVGQLLERMASVYDEPFMDSSNIPTYLIAQYARQHVKVVLSGDGADELFGGYAWYPPLDASEKVKATRLKWIVARSVSKVLGHGIAPLELYSRGLGLAARWPDVRQRFINYKTTFAPAERRTLWGAESGNVGDFAKTEYYQPPSGTSGMNNVFHFDWVSFLPGDILVKVDRAAMAHGLETRAPFLDRDLVEFAASLPATLKVDGTRTKILFKHALNRYWPPSVQSRPKLGFGSPYQIWLQFPEVKTLTQRVFAVGSPLRRLLSGFRPEMMEGRPYETWNLLTLGLWLERHAVG
jgi:asparagine synthase (glutamine-hydrolysing)